METTSYPSAAALVTANLLILAATNVLFPLAASRCKEAQSSSVRATVPHGRPAAHRQPHPPDPSTAPPCQREKAKRPLSLANYPLWNAGRHRMAPKRPQHGNDWANSPYGGAVRLPNSFNPGGRTKDGRQAEKQHAWGEMHRNRVPRTACLVQRACAARIPEKLALPFYQLLVPP